MLNTPQLSTLNSNPSTNLPLALMKKGQAFNRIEYVVSCVGEFSMRYGLTNSQAYAYLRRFAGIDFLLESYEAEHTLSIDDAVNDLVYVCSHKGGKIS